MSKNINVEELASSLTKTMEINLSKVQEVLDLDINDLIDIVEILRSPDGCPWDREQDHKSIRRDFLEETYEVIEAINKDDRDGLLEELGDVLLQVVFHTRHYG